MQTPTPNKPSATRSDYDAIAEELAAREAAATTPATRTATAPVVASDEAIDLAIDRFVAEFAGGGGATHFKFSKDCKYRRTSDDEEIPVGTELIAIYDQIQTGYIRFNGKGNPPTRHMGSLFAGFIPPARDTLDDTNPLLWQPGPSGAPADPWQMQMLLPLVNAKTGEAFVFGTTSTTGRGAVGKLVLHCKRMRRSDPLNYPVIRLDLGGFAHRDPRIGWVTIPTFPVIGKAPKDGSAVPDTSLSGEMNDAIPF